MHEFIQEFSSAISPGVCTRLIQKFKRYESNPTEHIRVVDKYLTDGGDPEGVRSKEARVIYLNADVLRAEDAEFLELVQICVESMSHGVDAYMQRLGPINLAPIEVNQIDMMRYDQGEGFYGRHVDAGSQALQHRVLSFVMYLNDVEEGGETEFPLQEILVKPEAGKLVVFPSYFCFVHGSRKVVSGPKYVLVAFSSFAM